MIRKISRSSAIVSPGRPADKIEDTMMSAPEPVSFEQPIGVSDEIAVGEKEQFDQFIHGLVAAARLRRRTRAWRRRTTSMSPLGQQC